MTYSITGFVYLYGFLAFAFLSYRFYLNWQREKTTVSKGFFLFMSIMSLMFIVTAIGGLFFADSPGVLKFVEICVVFIQSSAAAVLGYLIPYMKIPKISPWLGFLMIFLSGLVATFLSAITDERPFLEPNGVINWNIGPHNEILRPLIFLGVIMPIGIILIRQGMALKDKEAKIKAIGLGFAFLTGVFTGILDFTLKSFFHFGASSVDISVVILATTILTLIVL